MKKFIFFILYLFLGIVGCEEEKGLLFNDKARVKFKTGSGSAMEDYSYSFVWKDESTSRDTIFLPIDIMGGPSDKNRQIMLEQVSEYDVSYEKDKWGHVIDSVVTERTDKAVADQHYVAFDNPEYQKLSIVSAGEVSSRIGVIVLRAPSLVENKVRLRIRLKANDDFELGESKFLERTIVISDMLEKPSNWDSRYMDRLLGNYSKTKHQLMIKVVGKDEKVDEEWIEKVSQNSSALIYWRMKFIEALDIYNNNPENIKAGLAPMREDENDPNSRLVEFPTDV